MEYDWSGHCTNREMRGLNMGMDEKDIKFGRALSELSAANNFLDSYSYIEISKNENGIYKCYKTSLSLLNTALIETYSLYNNLEDIFNSNNYISCAYFKTDTYFAKNPHVHSENNKDYSHLRDGNRLITRKTFEQYMNDTGICVPVMNKNSNYHYYDADSEDWKVAKEKIPTVMSYQNDSIWTVKSNLKFEYVGDNLLITPEVMAPKNIMLDVCGNIFLDKGYETHWWDQQKYMVGLTINGNVIMTQFLKNILKIDNYTIAQFHLRCPIAANINFRIFANTNCQYFIDAEEKDFNRKLYSGINAVNLSYYD